ncbi:hypothetical protein [Sporolactobacillus inulinus]|uniref:Uncharacterized protein n=1 Tax=Sporolactobacillus inulinus CASD TaxID=1069536 RepID=A0A0U1QP16_9BACL|nr:hypothetical protein [Sporolactobacillus inulinus]KLI02548.1 hypothetical protein SINU_07495 [Sporolactobacillus inulinus CASD]
MNSSYGMRLKVQMNVGWFLVRLFCSMLVRGYVRRNSMSTVQKLDTAVLYLQAAFLHLRAALHVLPSKQRVLRSFFLIRRESAAFENLSLFSSSGPHHAKSVKTKAATRPAINPLIQLSQPITKNGSAWHQNPVQKLTMINVGKRVAHSLILKKIDRFDPLAGCRYECHVHDPRHYMLQPSNALTLVLRSLP